MMPGFVSRSGSNRIEAEPSRPGAPAVVFDRSRGSSFVYALQLLPGPPT